MRRDSVLGTIAVAAGLCIVCSILVSTAAVGLRPRQVANKQLFQKKNILLAAGLVQHDEQLTPERISQLFENIETEVAELDTGKVTDAVDPATYEQKAAARDPKLSVPTEGLAGFQTREKYSLVYLLKKDGNVAKIVLPVYGKGLWSTLYGYLALESDKNTIAGLTFYEHRETPGLGGEVDNPIWKAKWVGKKVSNDQDEIVIEVLKGAVDTSSDSAQHQIDGLSGATITSRGVSNLVQYWMSPAGFGKYLEQL